MKPALPPLVTRSLFAVGLGCTLAALPLGTVSAQEAEKPPTTTTTTDPMPSTAGSPAPTDGVQKAAKPVEPKHVKDTLTLKERVFMRKAASGNLAEVQMAELALKNGENQAIKDFAQKMIDDHAAANKDLEQVAQDDGVFNFRPEMTSEDKATFAKMSMMKGTAFDTGYIKHAVVDHEADVKEYKMAEKEGKNPALTGYVKKTLPIIEGHLKMAKELEATKSKAVNS